LNLEHALKYSLGSNVAQNRPQTKIYPTYRWRRIWVSSWTGLR
jgi:hypothetical protein